MKNIRLILLSISISIFITLAILAIISLSTAHSNDDIKILDLRIIPIDEVNDVFSNSEVIVFDEIKDAMYVNRYYKDGSVTSIREGNRQVGLWFIDSDNQHCLRWKKNDNSDCGLIMQDDEGNWVKVKKDKILIRYENIESIPTPKRK
jgi:hypothetical protein